MKMVNLWCPKCSTSLDLDANHIECYCPNCGGKLFITVEKAMDIWDEKKELKTKGSRYVKEVNGVKTKPRNETKTNLAGVVFAVILMVVLAAALMKFGGLY